MPRLSKEEKIWRATFLSDDEPEPKSLTWGELGKLIEKMSQKHKKQTVEVNDDGHDVFGECLKFDKQGNPYIKGY